MAFYCQSWAEKRWRKPRSRVFAALSTAKHLDAGAGPWALMEPRVFGVNGCWGIRPIAAGGRPVISPAFLAPPVQIVMKALGTLGPGGTKRASPGRSEPHHRSTCF